MKYIVRDENNNLQIIQAIGFIPPNAICQAPPEASNEDGDCIDLVDGVASLNQGRKNQKQADKQALLDANQYKVNRAREYPDFRDYLDGIVKSDSQQVQDYIDQCLAVKAKYPKPE